MKSGPKKRPKKRPAGRSKAPGNAAPHRKPGVKRRPTAAKLGPIAGVIEVNWPGVRTVQDGKEKRFYRMDTLVNAVQGLLANKQCWLLEGMRGALGAADITSLTFHFDREDRHRLIFMVDALNAKGKKGKFFFSVARNHQEHTRGLERRLEGLDFASRLAPAHSLQLYSVGAVFLPDRHGRPSHMRSLLAAVTSAPDGKTATWLKSGQIVLDGQKPEVLSLTDSDAVRAQVTELVLRCYDPLKRDGIAPPTLDTGDLLISRPARGKVKAHYAGGNTLAGRPNPVRLLARLFEDRGGGIWLPQDPDTFAEAVVAAAGKDRGFQWLRDYVKQADGGSVTSPGKAYVDALREHVVE